MRCLTAVAEAVLIERCVYIGLGIFLGLLAALYGGDRISLTLETVLHFLGVNVVLLGAAYIYIG